MRLMDMLYLRMPSIEFCMLHIECFKINGIAANITPVNQVAK